MTIQQSILVGSIIIALVIIGAKIVAPYQISGFPNEFEWKLNTVTGQIQVCTIQPEALGRGSHVCRE